MRKRFLVLVLAAAFSAGACGTHDTDSSSESPADATGDGLAAPDNTFNPAAVTGSAEVGERQPSGPEMAALKVALEGFAATYPNVTTTLTTISDPYRDNMVKRFGDSDPPDVFSIDGEYAQDWIDQGFLLSLDDYIGRQGFETSSFFESYNNIFRGDDGGTYGLAKDGSTVAMAVNTDVVPTPPTTMDELVRVATSLKGDHRLRAPMCLQPALDPGLAFLYAQGGSLMNEDNSAEAIDSPASKAAVQWYLDLFKKGLAQTTAELGVSSCVGALGKADVAIVFEHGPIKAMMNAFPNTKWSLAEMPIGTSGSKVTISFSAAYGIGSDSANKDQGWTVLQYLVGAEGMEKSTAGGIAAPSRSDVPPAEGLDPITAGAIYAKPGSGLFPGFDQVEKAFADAFLKEITDQTYSADRIVAATKAKIDLVLSD